MVNGYVKTRSIVKFCLGHEATWAEILGKDIKEAVWLKFYQNNCNGVIEMSLRAFQYQILLRTTPTTKCLARCNLVENNKYWFCKESVEIIEHLFWFLPYYKNILVSNFRCNKCKCGNQNQCD